MNIFSKRTKFISKITKQNLNSADYSSEIKILQLIFIRNYQYKLLNRTERKTRHIASVLVEINANVGLITL